MDRVKTRWELTLRGRMLALLASLASLGAWMTGDPNACLGAALLLAPLLVDALWRIGGLPQLEVSVAPRRTQAGALFEERVHIYNRSPRRAVRDLFLSEPATRTRAGAAHLELLGAGESATAHLPARCLRRGRYARREWECETCYPLGLVRNWAVLQCDAEVISEPARVDLATHWLPSQIEASGVPAQRRLGSQDFYALREYRVGEDARSVHALRSAASATLVARDMRGEVDRDTCVVIDLRRPPGYAATPRNRQLEWSLGAAATLIDQLPQRGYELTVFLVDDSVAQTSCRAPLATEELLTALASASTVVHHSLHEEHIETLRSFGTCLWVAGGGFAARDDRAAVGNVRLIQRRRQR